MSLKGGGQTHAEYSDAPTKGQVFDVLSNERRRYVVRALRDSNSSVDLGGLAEQVAAWENDIPLGEVTYNQRKSVYTALQQSHLPKMDDAGAIQFEENRGVIESDTHIDSFDYYLTVVPSGTYVFSHYYVLAGLAGTLVGLLVGVGLVSIPFMTDLAVGGGIIGLFGALTVLHMLHRTDSKMEQAKQEVAK